MWAAMVLVGKPPKEAWQGTLDEPPPLRRSLPWIAAGLLLTRSDQERDCLDDGRHGDEDADDQIDVGGHDEHPFRPAHP
jgi:hypothetical protein